MTEAAAPTLTSRQVWWWVLLPLLGTWIPPFFDLDEGFYAAIVSEMSRRGDWITPFYNGAPWFEKPILIYWAALIPYQLFGSFAPEFAMRLPSGVATMVTAWILTRWLAATGREPSAGVVALIYGSMLLPVVMGHLMTPDALFVMCLAGALSTFFKSLELPKFRVATGFWLGMGVLAKGPVTLAFFGAFLIWQFLGEKELRPAWRGGWLGGIAVMVAVICTWYLPCYLVNRELFVQEFLIEQNVNRFLGGDTAHRTPFWMTPIYFPVILLIAALPWSLRAIRSRTLWKECADYRYAARWLVLVTVFFSISQSKLPHYILPAFPALAMVAAISVAPGDIRRLTGQARWTIGIVTALVAGGLVWWGGASGQLEARDELRLAKRALPGAPIVLFQLPKQEGIVYEARLQQTSLPSMVAYANRVVLMTSEPEDLDAQPAGDSLLFTRTGRITPEVAEAIRAHGGEIELITGTAGGAFESYRLRRP